MRKQNVVLRFPYIFLSILSRIVGWLYRQVKILQEKLRLWAFNRNRDYEDSKILGEILYHSKKFLIYFLLLALISIFLDVGANLSVDRLRTISLLTGYLNLPSRDFIGLLLQIFIGAISALLGLIFALYSVGFQISTEKYSEKVTEYINQERVGNYFFRLLIFTVLFSLFTLLRLELANGLPFASFAISVFLVASSILGIIIFKDHYLISLKPISLFRRIWGEIQSFYKNISRKRSLFSKSYNIVQHSQKQVARLIDVAKALFHDLKRNQNYEDAYYGPIVLGDILRDYLDTKRYIDQDRAWWFPLRYERVGAEDLTMYPIKANYEMQGIAPFTVTKPYLSWLEDSVLTTLEGIQNDVRVEKQDSKICSSLIEGYKIILAGRYSKQTTGYVKTQLGAFENQEFATFDKALGQFFELSEALPDDESIFGRYLNALGDIKTVIVDGFNFRKHPGVLIPWEHRISPWIDRLVSQNQQLGITRTKIESSDLPTFFRGVLIDYWERLEVEIAVEGQVVTPKNRLENEIKGVIGNKEKEVLQVNLLRLTEHIEQIIRKQFKSNKQRVSQCLLLNYFTLVQLLDEERWDNAEGLVEIMKNDPAYILYLSRNHVMDIELREPIEKALFISLINRKRKLYDFCLKSLLVTLFVLRNSEENEETIIKFIRIPLMIGGLSYLVSELDQDFYYVILLAQYLERGFYMEGRVVELIEAAENIKSYLDYGEHFRLIMEEANRYRHFYRYVLEEIRRLPEDWFREHMEFGYNRTVKHPSEFIRQIAAWELSDMEQCIEGFIEWMKRREQIRRLTVILNNIPNEFL